MLVTVEERDGGRVATKIAGDPDHPTTHGSLCTKVSRYLERAYHKDRLRHPLKRVGPKGKGAFERVSWDEALDDIAKRLGVIAARDPERIVPYSYAGTMGLVQGESMAARFFNKLGASRLDRTICASAGAEALGYTLGTRTGPAMEAFAEAKLIIFWGANAIASNLHLWTFAQAAKRNGAKLIAIDPYRSLTAEKCHEHIALLPGTDGALALGLMHVLIREGWLDRDYIERYTVGFDGLAALAEQYSPERVAALCGLGAEQIERLAHDYWHIRPAAIRANYGMQRAHGGGNAVRAIACLPALAGHWRSHAGGVLLSTSGTFNKDRDALERPDLLARADGTVRNPRTINMSTIGRDLSRSRSADRGADRLQQQSRGRGAGVAARGRGLRARGSLHRRARAVPDRHGRLRRLRAARDDPARARRHALGLRPPLRAREQPRDRAARRGAAEHGDLPACSRRAWGSRTRAFATATTTIAAVAFKKSGTTARHRMGELEGEGLAAARAADAVRAVRARAASRRRPASASSTARR